MDDYQMRRHEREISKEEAKAILHAGEYGVLSTVASDGTPYGVPLSYCVLDDSLYFHCAIEGHKLDNLAADERVSFCVVGKTEVLPEKFSTRYESVIITGRATEALDDEKQLALEGLQAKYSPQYHSEGVEYIAKAWHKTRVFKVSIDRISGKARR